MSLFYFVDFKAPFQTKRRLKKIVDLNALQLAESHLHLLQKEQRTLVIRILLSLNSNILVERKKGKF